MTRRSGALLLVLGLTLLMLIGGWWYFWPVQTTCEEGISREICAEVAAEARSGQWANHRTTVAVQAAPEGWTIPDPTGDLAGEEAPWAALLDGTLRIACWREIETINCQRLGEPVEGDG